MRRLSSLISRRSSGRPVVANRRSTGGATQSPAPPVKRCLNEGGHKLYR